MRTVRTWMILALIGAALAGCPRRNGPRSERKAKLTIISPHHEQMRQEYTAAFQGLFAADKAPEVEWMDQGGTADDLRYVKSEFQRSPEGIGIDLFFGGGIDPFLELKSAGALEAVALDEELLSGIPDKLAGVPLHDPGNQWFGSALSGFGIIYNKVVIANEHLPTPKTWADLGLPSLVDRVGATDPRHSGSAHMMYEIILQAYGWEKGWPVIASILANARTIAESASALPRGVSSGEMACAGAIDFYAWTQIQEHGEDMLGYVMPAGMTVINPDGIAILKGAPHRDVAEQFVEMVLGEVGQRLLMLPVGATGGPEKSLLCRMSVRPALYDELGDKRVVRFNPFTDWSTSLEYDADLGSLRWSVVNDLIGARFIDVHSDLKRAWEVIIENGAPEDDVLAAFARPPVSEQEALDLAREHWNTGDSATINRLKTEWTATATERYQSYQ